MDWNFNKGPSWEVTELEGRTISRISPMLASSSSGGQRSKGDFSVDLKLGRLGDFGEGLVERLKDPKLTPSKRARAPINGTSTVSCLVDGCKSDLSTCREYHRRHKVCELHSKTPKVMVGGKEQRFCQQCSRFHSLVEFDEVKRSCRKRLDGHNRRRRKSPLQCLPTGSGRFLSNYQGTNSLSFPSPQIYPTTTEVSRTTWKSDVKSMGDTMLYNLHRQPHLLDKQNLLSLSSRYCNSGRKQFPFLHGDSTAIGSQTAPQASRCQLLFNAIASSEEDGGSQKILYDGFNHVLDSARAPSLLSSLPNQTLGIGLSHGMHADLIPQVNTLVPALHYNVPRQFSFTQDMEDESVTGLVLVPTASCGNLKSQDIFQVGPDESSANEAPQTLTPVGCRFD